MSKSAHVLGSVALTFLAVAAGVCFPPNAFAQTARVAPGSDDLRAAYANAAEVEEGKRVAETSCASCHGADGISATKGIPNLAGQRPAYLYVELRAYRSGARGDDTMRTAVRFLSEDALVKVAAYYASLDPAQPAAGDAAKAVNARPDPVQAGKTAAAACGGCHGEAGVGKIPGMPSLAGLDPKYLVAAMKAYKSGQRKNEFMSSALAKTTRRGHRTTSRSITRCKSPANGKSRRRRRCRRQGGRGGVCRVPRRHGSQRESGDPEPRRSGCEIFRCRTQELQGRFAPRRAHERAGGAARRDFDQEHGAPITRRSSRSRQRSASRSPPPNGRSGATDATASTATAPTRACRRSPGSASIICRRCCTPTGPARGRARRWPPCPRC